MRCKALKKLFENFIACLSGYCKYSHLHGFRNISRADVKWYESLFWIVVCLSGVCMTLFMSVSVWNRYQLSPTITTIETNNFPISKVPFPAVTFCNLNQVLKSSFELMAQKFEDHGVERSVLKSYLTEIFGIYLAENRTFVHEELIKKTMRELGYSLESFIFDLAQPCSEFLVRCFWSGKTYDCSTLFEEVKTLQGFCCTFNWRGEKMNLYGNNTIRKLSKKENVLLENGEKNLFLNDGNVILTGLTVIVDPDEGNYLSALNSVVGSLVILHEASEYPDMGSRTALIQERSHAVVRLKASLTESTKNVRRLKISQRMCYFDGEFSIKSGYKYSYETCIMDCKIRDNIKECGCIPYNYPNVTESVMCDLSGMKCIVENGGNVDTGILNGEWNLLNYGHHCKCLPSCNDVRYDWAVEVNEIRNTEHLSAIIGKNFGSRSIISVYFEQNVCIKYRVDSLITWDSLIASFGGIFGLCLGGSIISLIELLYYVLYDYRKSCRNEVTLKTKRVKKSKIHSIEVNPRIMGRSHWGLKQSLWHYEYFILIK